MTKKIDTDIILTVRDLTVRFGDATILDRISFTIARGEFVGLIGPNGAGKSTLFKALLNLEPLSNGSFTFAPGLIVRYVPQHYVLPSHVPVSVAEVVHMGTNKHISHKDLLHTLAHVGLDEVIMHKNFHALSGGQKQRVIIARALVAGPDIIFFDEPLSGVDALTKTQIYELLEELNTKHGMTILFVSHDIDHVIKACDRVLCLDHTLHAGCHPTDFVHGARDHDHHTSHGKHMTPECLTHQDVVPLSEKPVHHHHHSS